MLEAPAETGRAGDAIRGMDHALQSSGPVALLDRLIDHLRAAGEHRALLDALLLKARYELGLPLIQVGSLNDLPEPTRSKYEDHYVEAIRTVGGLILATGDIPGAWPYFRAIGETEPVREAITTYVPQPGDERLGQIIEVAFNQGAHPRKGFELILDNYGTCSAISAFEHIPADEVVRAACTDRLVRQVHEHLVANLRAEISHRGQPLPPEGAPIAKLVEGNDWLFGEDAYHIDVSHLASTVRVSPLLTDSETIALAIALTDYGRRLSDRHRYEGEPPFEQTYEDHAIYLRALLGQEVDEAIAHFRTKIEPADPDRRDGAYAAQVLIGLLVRIDRLNEAITLAGQYLAGLPESALTCPGVAQLCQRAGQPARLAEIARSHGDLVNYAAALLQLGEAPPSS